MHSWGRAMMLNRVQKAFNAQNAISPTMSEEATNGGDKPVIVSVTSKSTDTLSKKMDCPNGTPQ